jgi:DeoR family deoxyribose operon repressor
MRKKAVRLDRIVALLKEHNGASIRELSETLHVSVMTVRRDLTDLANDNVVKLIFGGVVLNPENFAVDPAIEYRLQNERDAHPEAKAKIGKKAASLVEPGDIIIVDSGTTSEALVRNLPQSFPITVLCYASNILEMILKRRNCTPIFAGGFFHSNTLMFESPEGVELIKRNRANKAFVAASGAHEKLGVTCAKAYETHTKSAVIKSSLRKILMIDSSKFDIVKAAHFAELTDFDTVITDAGIPQRYQELLKELKVDLFMV